jgi:phosphoserine phosphatase
LKLTKGVKELIDRFHSQGIVVYLVSGGFRQMIDPVASELRIPSHRVFANNLLFSGEDGSFGGFDREEPTCRDGGKSVVLAQLLAEHAYQPLVMVGDGVTDMQARPPAHLFLGFGGVVAREPVRKGADWFFTDFQQLVDVLDGK